MFSGDSLGAFVVFLGGRGSSLLLLLLLLF